MTDLKNDANFDEEIAFGITREMLYNFIAEDANVAPQNVPLRPEGQSFFEAMMSDEADITQDGWLDEEGLRILRGED